MGEPKAFASLSSGLLARKGAARPAMRPQGFGQVGAGLDDLGWNDMGFEAPKPALSPVRDDQHDAFGAELSEPALRNPLAALTPVASPVHDQQAEIADRFADYTEESSDEEYVDETAELYDPEADEALAVAAAEVEEQEEEALVLDAPLLSVKPSRVIVPANETEAAQAPVAATPVAVPAPVASAPVAAVRNAAPRQPRQRAAAGSKA